MSTDPKGRAWLEVDARALRRNLRRIRESVGPGVGVLPLVKADAYGTGLVPAAKVLEREDPWGFGVATVTEGSALRAAGIRRRILVVSPVPPGMVAAALEADLTICASDLGTLRAVKAAVAGGWGRPPRVPGGGGAAGGGGEGGWGDGGGGEGIPIHVEIDTGMGRSGFDWRRVGEWWPAAETILGGELRVEGVFTHFHSADAPGIADASRPADAPRPAGASRATPAHLSVTEQLDRFRKTVRRMVGDRPRPEWVLHAANSAASLRAPDASLDLVRPGIFLYGGVAGAELPRPDPVVSLRARVVLIRDVPAGSTLGYGATHRASRPERWATVAIGYGDGLPRSLGNRGSALLAGQRVRIVGRISMDLTVVDITDLGDPAPAVGAEVTFIGSDGSAGIPVEEVAELAGTINYEVLTGFTARLPRVWVGSDEGSA